MAEIHKCGQGWAYCDGNCTTCAVNNCYTTNGTITLVKDYPPYLDHPKEWKKQTNADKYFRNATDEELAEFLAKNQKIGDVEQYEDGYRQLWLDWLKQEVSDV